MQSHQTNNIQSTSEPRRIGSNRRSPINSFDQHRQLRRSQHCGSFLGQGPNKSTALKPFRVEAQASPIPPQDFYLVGSLAAKGKDMPVIRALLDDFLHEHGEPIESFPHVSRTTGNPDLRSHRHRDHRPHPSKASASGATHAGTALPERRNSRPLRNTTSTMDSTCWPLPVGRAAPAPSATATSTKGGWPDAVDKALDFA